MVAEFPKMLSQLRQEKGVSQRNAAACLNVSQALLSHYENGAREPGLDFLLRAARYYGVSTDYLLGRTTQRDRDGALTMEHIHAMASGAIAAPELANLRQKQLSGAESVLFALLEKTNDKTLVDAVSRYLSMAVYKALRYLDLSYEAEGDSLYCDIPDELFGEVCDAEMKAMELVIKREILSAKGNMALALALNDEILRQQYPQAIPAVTALLAMSDEALKKNS